MADSGLQEKGRASDQLSARRSGDLGWIAQAKASSAVAVRIERPWTVGSGGRAGTAFRLSAWSGHAHQLRWL